MEEFSWNIFNWSLSPGVLFLVLFTTLNYFMSLLKLNGVGQFPPCLPELFTFLFLFPPERDNPILPMKCYWFTWSSPCRDVALGVSNFDINFVLRVEVLYGVLEVLIPDVNFILNEIPSLELLVLFSCWSQYIWFWCSLCTSFLILYYND